MTTETPAPRDGRELMELFLPNSPFVAKLGVQAVLLEDDAVRLILPWDPTNITVGTMVHGGAIAGLIDITAMACAWSGAPLPAELRGVTTSMAVEFLAPARETDLFGIGRILRRGRSLVNVDVEIRDPEDLLVAKAIATYKVG